MQEYMHSQMFAILMWNAKAKGSQMKWYAPHLQLIFQLIFGFTAGNVLLVGIPIVLFFFFVFNLKETFWVLKTVNMMVNIRWLNRLANAHSIAVAAVADPPKAI